MGIFSVLSVLSVLSLPVKKSIIKKKLWLSTFLTGGFFTLTINHFYYGSKNDMIFSIFLTNTFAWLSIISFEELEVLYTNELVSRCFEETSYGYNTAKK
jgi:hypothetical protein